MFKYTDEMLVFLEQEYKQLPIADLTKAFNAKFATNKSKVAILGILKRKGFPSGRDGRFRPGDKPWNTGTQGLMPPNRTSFKRGHIPANTKQLGSERIDSKDGYILIKVAQGNKYTGARTRYMHKHVFIYEKEYGPVPDGHVVRFKDGDKTNIQLSNLELITKAENSHLNRIGYSDIPDKFKPAMMAVAKIEARMFKLISREENE